MLFAFEWHRLGGIPADCCCSLRRSAGSRAGAMFNANVRARERAQRKPARVRRAASMSSRVAAMTDSVRRSTTPELAARQVRIRQTPELAAKAASASRRSARSAERVARVRGAVCTSISPTTAGRAAQSQRHLHTRSRCAAAQANAPRVSARPASPIAIARAMIARHHWKAAAAARRRQPLPGALPESASPARNWQ